MKNECICTMTAGTLLLAAILSSCGGEHTSPVETQEFPTAASAAVVTETEAPEPRYIDSLEQRDFGEKTFTIIAQDNAERQNFYHEQTDGDTINDAIRQRDIETEERLNIRLEYLPYDVRGDVTNVVQKVIRAGDEAYDLVINSLSDGINTLTVNGMLYDLTTVPHLTLDSVYWNKSMTENVRFYGKQYFTTGPISPLLYQTPIVMMFNKRVAADYDIGDLYQLVLDGKWTVDRLYEISHTMSHDLNADGKMDENDFWGFVTDGSFGNVLYTAAGYNTVEEKDGIYALTLDSERSVSLIEKCASYFGDRNTVINDRNGQESYASTIFDAGNALFMSYTVLGVLGRRDMKDDFGIIPCPKLEETQKVYCTSCNTWLATGVAVPMLCSDPEGTGLIMETMAYYSYENLLPAVYEKTLRGKVARDDASSIMLDYIFENASFDFNTIFDFGGTSILLRDCMLGEVDNFVSQYQKKLNAANKALEKVMEFAKAD